jgi:hypothetical protein
MDNLIIQFVAEASIGSALICYGTHSPVSHCDGVLPDGSLLGSRTGILTGTADGVAIRPANYLKFSFVQRMAFPVDSATALDMAKTYIGDPYSWEEDCGYVIPWFWKHNPAKSYNCSAFWVHIMRKCGVDPFTAPGYSVSPRDLLYSPLAEKV